VIKTVMAMREGVLPKTLHVDQPSSKVEWGTGQVELLTEAEPWQANGKPRRAGVSSFGISGTNAHLILEEALAPSGAEQGEEGSGEAGTTRPLSGPIPFLLSAKSEPALREGASRLAAHLEANPDLDPTDVAFSLATTRSAFPHRAVALGEDRGALLRGLGAIQRGEETAGVVLGTGVADARLAYLFTGQGSQRVGMGKELYEAYPAYAEAFDLACELFDAELEEPLGEIIFGSNPDAAQLLDHTSYAQPALFATEVALFRLLESWGIRPGLLCGHSIGEVSAAHVAGVFGLADAAKLVAARGRLMGDLPEGGAMLAVEATEAEAVKSLQGKELELSVAAINGPRSVVLSGALEPIEEAQGHWQEQARKTKRLAVSHAFHSPLIEPMLEEFGAVARGLDYGEPTMPVVSNLSGELLTPAQATDPAYWVAHARQPVRFAAAVATMRSQGATAFVELGPDPVLTAMARECLEDEGAQATFAPTLRKDRSELQTLIAALTAAHAAGIEVGWEDFFADSDAKAVALPTYPFQRQRYWIDSSGGPADAGSVGQSDPEHPLLGAVLAGADGQGLTLTGRLSLATHPWLKDHAVAGRVLLPGTAFVELALRAGRECSCELLEELALEAPLILSERGAVQVQVAVSGPGEEGDREVSIHSRPEAGGGEGEEWTCNARGVLAPEAADALEPIGAWPPPGADPLDLDLLCESLADAGFEYGPAFQGLTALWRDGGDLYAEVSLPPGQAAEAGRFALHPALLDAALQAIALAAIEAGAAGEMRLPFAWSEVALARAGAGELRVKASSGPAGERVSLLLADGEGAPLGRIGSLVSRPFDPAQLRDREPRLAGLLALEWRKASLAEARGGEAQLFELPAQPGDDRAGAARELAAVALGRIQGWLAAGEEPERRLAILTRGAVAAAGGESPDPAKAAVWGLVRSAQAEHPGRLLLVDTDGSEASEAALSALLRSDGEPELALRDGVALAPRAVPVESKGEWLTPPPGPWHLSLGKPGTLESLTLEPNPAALEPLAPGQVRIAVHAAGLNFRDVLIALGLYPGEVSIGREGAGTVLDAGPGVGDLSPGDRVMGLLGDAFSAFAVAERQLLRPVPEGWSFAEAASVPTVFLTAHYGLFGLAAIQPGERVLVHAGAGGVGMAAIGLAQHRGAEVFATASPGKWDALREAGLDDDHIASSRELGFKAKFLAATNGEGVDVVLNSLAGEFVDASLELLPRGGRFLEMGKTDIRDAERVAAGHPGVTYRSFDLFEAGPERHGEMLAEIVALFEAGELRHSPVMSWDLRHAPGAFRHLREGKNVGKLVLEVPRPLDPDRTVLITGGCGGLGSLVARCLAEEHGARQLLLAGRSGEQARGAKELRAALQELGAEVRIAACDVSKREQLEALLDSIPAEHRLGAVVHAAGAIKDATVEALDASGLEPVFAPKADAAWHLHELTASLDLSAFVMFSSAAGVLGSPGQANYAAANAFLDALAQRRRAEGLPATSIAWGLWQRESTMTSHLGETDLARMRRAGITTLTDRQGLDRFGQALRGGHAATLALGTDQAGLRAQAAAGALPAVLGDLVRAPARRRRGAGPSLAKMLASAPEAGREALVLDLVRAEVATVLGHGSPAAIEPSKAFKELGFDSLAAVELRNRLQAASGLRLGATTVFDYPSPESLAGFLAASIVPGAKAEPALESQEHQIREALASIPLSRLRGAGLLDSLIRLAEGESGAATGAGENGELIDTMDVEELIRESAV
jgi:acyl transferase domain-containing protein/NADPH:quinone reductase-like Zn-dependent oxidoreductase/NADP-dependent 3-hydroxy acid dehydrogenase YdfG/acyl carrier protein